MDDVHPIRVWRVDETFRSNIDATRQLLKRAQRKFKQIGGIQFFEREMALTHEGVNSFEALQGQLYKYDESTGFLFSFLKFWDHHRQVFEFERNLADALSATDIGDVPWSELRLPHNEFYLALGDYGQRSFLIGDFEYIIDGVYIRHVNQASVVFPNDSLLMHFTAKLLRPSYRDAKALRKGYATTTRSLSITTASLERDAQPLVRPSNVVKLSTSRTATNKIAKRSNQRAPSPTSSASHRSASASNCIARNLSAGEWSLLTH